jgi:hypothetical protein
MVVARLFAPVPVLHAQSATDFTSRNLAHGSGFPAACVVGDLFYSAASGLGICTATNTWSQAGGGAVTFAGDLSGTSSSQTVVGLDGVPLCTGYAPAANYYFHYRTDLSPSPCWTTNFINFSVGGVLNTGQGGLNLLNGPAYDGLTINWTYGNGITVWATLAGTYTGVLSTTNLPVLTTSQDILINNSGALGAFHISSIPNGECYGNVSGSIGPLVCGGGVAIGGTVTSGTLNNLLYVGSGPVLSQIAAVNNAVLITGAGGVPSESQTLPTLVEQNITQVGTIAAGVWNGTALTSTYLPSTVVYTGQANTYSAGLQSFSSADFLAPHHASDPGTCTAGQFEYNTTTAGFKGCLTANTWTPFATGANTTYQLSGTTIVASPTFNIVSGSGISNSLTNVGGVATYTPSVNFGVVPSIATNQAGQNICNSTNGTTAYTCSLGYSGSAALTAYTTGMEILLVVDTTSSTTATVNVDNLGAITLKESDCATSVGTTVIAGRGHRYWNNGTYFCAE